MDVVVWGAGQVAAYAVNSILNIGHQIRAIVDNDNKKWGKEFKGYMVYSPSLLKKIQYDYLLIATDLYYDSIYKQVTLEYSIPKNKVKDYSYFILQGIKNYYTAHPTKNDSEIIELLKLIQTKEKVRCFNYDYVETINVREESVYYDNRCGMFYVYHNDKKMYFSKKFDSRQKVARYYRSLLIEQHVNSPHKYITDTFGVEPNNVVIDAGVAEGNFSLDIIDCVKHIYLVEADPNWIEALRYTFAPYEGKVTIINKHLSNKDDDDNISLDYVAKETKIDFIKMDIEGAESTALLGGHDLLRKNEKMKFAVCTYHNVDDYERITRIFQNNGFRIETSKGYMYYWSENNFPQEFVRGLVRAQKDDLFDWERK